MRAVPNPTVRLAMGRRLAATALALLVATGCASSNRLYRANDGTPAVWSVSGSYISVPFRTQNRFVLFEARVDGSEPLLFLLDSGAPVSVILAEALDDDRLAALRPGMTLGGNGPGPRVEARTLRDVTLSLPGLELVDQTLFVLPEGTLFDSPVERYFDGVIGYDLLKRFVVEVDYDRRSLTFHRPQAFRYRGEGDALPIRLRDRKPYVKVQILQEGGPLISVEALVDLGMGYPMSVDYLARADLELPDDAIAARLGRGIRGRADGHKARLDELWLGQHRLSDVLANFPDESSSRDGDCAIGARILSRFRLFFDYRGRRLILEPTARLADPFETDMSGLELAKTEDGRFRIKRVGAATPASEADFRVGDILLSIDGRLVEEMHADEVRESLQRGDGVPVDLCIASPAAPSTEIGLAAADPEMPRCRRIRLRRRI